MAAVVIEAQIGTPMVYRHLHDLNSMLVERACWCWRQVYGIIDNA
jgi:hypothetical protein